MAFFSVQDLSVLVSMVLWGAVAACAAGLWIHARGWRTGRTAPTDWLGGLLQLPRRYLVDVHAVVARHRPTSWMHAMVAGGFLASIAGWALLPWTAGEFWLALQLVALLLCGAGLLLLATRRYGVPHAAPTRPQRLSGGPFVWLPVAFFLYWSASIVLVGLLATAHWQEAGASSIAAALVVAATVVYLLGFAMQHPLRHALLGALLIATHPKPARFARGTDRRLVTRASGIALREGVGQTGDFDWKQLLSFDACIECGRCEAVCPAHATGHPLNPKALIQDLVRNTGLRKEAYGGTPHYRHDTVPDAAPQRFVLGIAHETLWSCTTCAACVNACPMFIEQVDAITDMRRHMTQNLGAVPGKLPAILRELRESGNSFGRPAPHRWSWATDLQLRLFRDVRQADVLVWAGDAGFELHGQQSLRALLQTLQIAGVDYAVLGEEEQDCGHLSRRCGDESTFAQLRQTNLGVLAQYRFGTLLTADPHAFHTLRNEYPDAGWEVMHHTEYLSRLLAENRLRPTALTGTKVVYHDACYLGRYGQVFDAPRSVLDQAGCERVEAPRSRDNSFCCGAGGGQVWAAQRSLKSIPVVRFEELAATGATEIAVACPNCKNMLQSAAGDRIRVRDVAEILRASL